MTHRTVCAAILVTAGLWPAAASGQGDAEPSRSTPKVEIVQIVGCIERRGGDIWLTRASDPEVVRRGVFNETQVEEARETAAGTGEFHLIGDAEFLGAEGLLRTTERAAFTTPEQVNATGGLREGRTVIVKGLLIEDDDESRINLIAVVPLSETCAE